MTRRRAPAGDASDLVVRALTPERWPDLARLFGARGVGGGCWCMYWRAPSHREYLRGKGTRNRDAMAALVREGREPGLIAYAGGEPVGWCAVAPRAEYPALARSPSRRRVDGLPVWSVTCLYLARSHRRRGLSVRLIEAAVAHARSRGARIVEAYPVPPKSGTTSTSYAFTGFVSAFEAAGFTEVCRRRRTRPILRREVRPARGVRR